MRIIACAVLAALVLIQNVDSSCYYGSMRSEMVDGKIREICQLQSQTFLSVGKTQTSDCVKCSCTKSGLFCCGIGYNAGTMAVKDCTMKKLDKCCFKFVHNQTGEDCTPISCPDD